MMAGDPHSLFPTSTIGLIRSSKRLFVTSIAVRALALTCLTAVLGFGAGIAHAHNSYDSSTPADNDVLEVSPSEWIVSFAKDVPLDSASAEMISADGVRSDLGPALPGPQANIVRFALPADLAGTTGLRWKLVSNDGHVISGRVSFTVDPTAGISTNSSSDANAPAEIEPVFPSWSESSSASEPVRWMVRFAVYLGLLLVGGLVLSELVMARGTLSSRRGSLVLRGAGGTLAIGSLLQVLFLLGDINDTSVIGALGKLADSFDSTPLGMTMIRFVTGVAVLGLSFVRVDESDEVHVSRLLAVLFGIFSVGLAYTSHSRSRAWPVLGVPADVVHTAAVTAWLGGLAILLLVVIPVVNDRDALYTFRRFGRAATIAVPVIVATGVVQTLRLHGGITTIFTQSHGRVLLLKLGVVTAMLALANKSRRFNLSRITDEPSRHTTRRRELTRASLAEIAVGGIVVAITAALVTSDFG